ncbi:uncharacterized protein LOC143499241 isoform X2 [Brachyhypopomus gauderio]|uniref:uncharacterized protein LOC143499241 isoform X2 n=1 Tax=Brachyhypopomus gauderio TaxID=698409 RepID=UPI0040415888
MLFETFSMGFWVLLLCAAYAVKNRGPIMPSIIMYSPSDFVGPTGPLQCLVKGAVPSQVRVVWIIDQSNRTGLTESAWTENSDSADEYTRATITITAEEWAKATHIECVVMYDGVEISKTLNRDSACIWLLYAGIAAVFLTVAVTVTLAVYLHKDLQSATTIKGYRGTYAQGKQNNGNRDTLRPTAMRPSAIMEVEYSSVNPDSFNQLGVVPPSEFD